MRSRSRVLCVVLFVLSLPDDDEDDDDDEEQEEEQLLLFVLLLFLLFLFLVTDAGREFSTAYDEDNCGGRSP